MRILSICIDNNLSSLFSLEYDQRENLDSFDLVIALSWKWISTNSSPSAQISANISLNCLKARKNYTSHLAPENNIGDSSEYMNERQRGFSARLEEFYRDFFRRRLEAKRSEGRGSKGIDSSRRFYIFAAVFLDFCFSFWTVFVWNYFVSAVPSIYFDRLWNERCVFSVFPSTNLFFDFLIYLKEHPGERVTPRWTRPHLTSLVCYRRFF